VPSRLQVSGEAETCRPSWLASHFDRVCHWKVRGAPQAIRLVQPTGWYNGSSQTPGMPPHRTDDDRSITASGLARLLARLDPDAERAGLEYEQLRRALVKFFDWRGASPPEDCADETLDRLSRRLEETVVENVQHYAHGIARLVLLERRRQPALSSLDGTFELARRGPAAVVDDEDDRASDCLDRCLADVPADGRSLILQYYEGERGDKIANRRRLAWTLGLSENGLRSRVHRLRDRLEGCVKACVSGTEMRSRGER
jgi:DNA-directed RNA polymerase specialized sigma24 family protein